MNKILLTGRLAKDPEVRYTESGKVVATLSLAVDRPFAGDDGKREADFIPCVIWGKQAEFVGNHFKKGKWMELEGRLQIRSYEKDGQRRYVTEVIVGQAGFVGAKDDGYKAPAQQSYDEEIPF